MATGAVIRAAGRCVVVSKENHVSHESKTLTCRVSLAGWLLDIDIDIDIEVHLRRTFLSSHDPRQALHDFNNAPLHLSTITI